MTRKQLATQLYWLNVQRGICSLEKGCGEQKWVRRTLNGIGASKGMSKEELQKAVAYANETI